MAENELLPLAIFNSFEIDQNNSSYKEFIAAEMSKIVPLLAKIIPSGYTLLCVIPINERVSQQAQYKLEQKMEDLIENILPDEWAVDLYVIRKRKNDSFTRMINEAELLIHKFSFFYPYETIIQLPGIGDADCFQAIFLQSMKQLGGRHGLLFEEKGKSKISLSKSSVSEHSWKLQIRSFLMEYDFPGAIELVKEQAHFPKALELLLRMMDSRLNFCFSEASHYLQECEKLLGEESILRETKSILTKLMAKEGKEQDLALIEELYRQMEVCIQLDDMPAFLTRFYRAREAILLFLLTHGAREGAAAHSMKKSSIYQLVEDLEKKYENGDVEDYIGTYFYLKSLNVAHTLQVRNQSFIGHGREQINSTDLWHSYFGTKRTTVSRVKRRFLLESNMMLKDLGASLDDNFPELIEYMLQMDIDFQSKGQETDEASRVLPI